MKKLEKFTFETFMNWDFVEKFYPNYYSCDDILLFDIFTRKLENEFVSESDEIFLKNLNLGLEIEVLQMKIWYKTLENYIKIIKHQNSKQ